MIKWDLHFVTIWVQHLPLSRSFFWIVFFLLNCLRVGNQQLINSDNIAFRCANRTQLKTRYQKRDGKRDEVELFTQLTHTPTHEIAEALHCLLASLENVFSGNSRWNWNVLYEKKKFGFPFWLLSYFWSVVCTIWLYLNQIPHLKRVETRANSKSKKEILFSFY